MSENGVFSFLQLVRDQRSSKITYTLYTATYPMPREAAKEQQVGSQARHFPFTLLNRTSSLFADPSLTYRDPCTAMLARAPAI